MRLGNRRRQTILLDDESETEEDEPDNRLLVSGSAELVFFFQLYEPFAQNLYKIFSKILNLHKNQLAYAN